MSKSLVKYDDGIYALESTEFDLKTTEQLLNEVETYAIKNPEWADLFEKIEKILK